MTLQPRDFHLGAQFVLWGLGKTQEELQETMNKMTVVLVTIDEADAVQALMKHPSGQMTWNTLDGWTSVLYQHQAVPVETDSNIRDLLVKALSAL